MYVLTVDQRRSRRSADLVEEALSTLNNDPRFPPLRRFERTAGDEFQAVFEDAAAVVEIGLRLVQTNHWSVGIGVGGVRSPLPASTRAGSGPAFEYAREAVEDAKHAGGHICVRGEQPACEDADAMLALLGALCLKRSDAAREAGQLLNDGVTQQDIAKRLGITQQAVSARLRSGLWQEDQRVRRSAVRQLEAAAP